MDNNFRREGSTEALPIGYSLHWYDLQEVIGRGGYGITYLANDRNLQRKVAIKEYLPLDFACRDATDTVHPITKNHKELFDWGLQRFLVEARTLAKFNHPAIIRVVSVFEHNKTAYMVMEYEEGDDMAIAYMEKAPFSEQQILDFFIPVIEGLALVHDAGFIHRDIKPSNIYVRNDGSTVLLDFGSARQTIGSRTRALTSLVTAGYAPFEQYNESEDAQGAWTDIYGLGATLYFCMTGAKPADAMERGSALLKAKRDIYQPLSHMSDLPYSDALKLAVDHALMFHSEERPQNAREWADMLTGNIALAPLRVEEDVEESIETASPVSHQITSPPDTDDSTIVKGNAQQRMATGPLSSAQETQISSVAEHTASDEDDDDSTRIYHRPSVKGQVAASSADDAIEQQQMAAAMTEQDGAKDYTTMVENTEAQRAETTDQTAIQQTQFQQTAIKQTLPQTPVKEKSTTQWQNKLRPLIDAIVSRAKSFAGLSILLRDKLIRLNDLSKKTKIAAAGIGGLVFLIVAGVLIAAVSDDDVTGRTLTVEMADDPTSPSASDIQQANQSPESAIQKATESLIQGLLAQAKLDVANNRILQPENDNAVYRYKKILTLRSDQPEAIQGLSVLAQRYKNLINATIDEKSWDQAEQQIEELKLITDDPGVIKPLQARLKDYEKSLQMIAKDLARADRYLKQNRLTRPQSANALFLYTKVLAVDPDNQRANEGVNNIVARLSDVMRKQVKSGRIRSAEKTFEKIESIDPNAPALKEAESKLAAIVERRKSIGKMLKSAERDFIRGNLTRPSGNNAYTKYREVLRISPRNKEAKAGLDRIYAYYVSSYYQYLNEARFDKAKNVVNTLRQIDYGKKQIVILRRMIQEEKIAAKNEPETIKLMLSQLEKGLKNKDISAVTSLSTFETKNKQFIKKLFDQYANYSVKVMQTDHDLKSHQAKARVDFSNLVVDDDEAEQAGKKEIKIDIQVSRNEDKQWKINW